MVVVIGSLNIDYIASVERLPGPGETVPASRLVQRFGGKGANQAVAAARQGARVAMLGCVGDDDAGRAYCRRLRVEGINTRGISTTTKALTGTALIAVDRSAENMIIVAPGANGELTPADVRHNRKLIESADYVLLQLEIPMPTVIEAVRLANKANVRVALNPSPLRTGLPWGKLRFDSLTVNVGEAEAIFHRPVKDLPGGLRAWQRALAQRNAERLLITRGANTTQCITRSEFFEVPPLRVKPVDTVGAGDAFAGTFVARSAAGEPLISALGYANCAGALATLKAGAQESIPTRAETERAMKRLANP